MKFTRKITHGIFITLLVVCSVISIAACSFKKKEATSISVAYEQGDTVVYETTSLDALKGSLTVTVHYSDGSSEATSEYVLTGTLTVGESTVTVSCQGFEKTFKLTVSPTPDTSHTHSLVKHEAKAPDCTESGNVEYWSCSLCNKNYSDAEATNEITDVILPAAHSTETEIRDYVAAGEYTDGYSGDTYCLSCGEVVSYGTVINHTSTAPALIISSVDVKDGTVTVVISLVNNSGIASMKFDLLYDSALTIESVEFKEELGVYVASPEPYINPQTFNWISADTASAYNGEFVTVTFSVDAELTESVTLDIVIILDSENIFDSQMNKVSFNAVGATVTVNG